MRRATAHLAALAGLAAAAVAAGPAAAATTDADVRRGLERLVAAPGGPPGAIATLHRDGRTTVLAAGRRDAARRGAPRGTDRMRLASVSKAFSGAVALALVRDGRLDLDARLADLPVDLPAAWGAVTVRQLLGHTSGLPDYTRSGGFAEEATTDPRGRVAPRTIIDWVRDEPLAFRPGSRYAYSNTDNIVVGLIAEAITGRPYRRLLAELVFRPAGLAHTTFPTGTALPRPFLHGYAVEPGAAPEDVSTALSPSGAWASGAIVSTPIELNAFIRAYLGGRLVAPAQRREQLRFVPGGQSSPPGPGANAAGLAIFRYRTRCGTVYGHTGSFPGYAQFAAATRDGRRAVTTSLSIAAPEGRLLRRLRAVQETAVCALLGR